MKTTKLPALALCAALAACGGGAGSGSGTMETQARNAMPRGENMQMKSPQSSSMRDDGTAEQNSTAGSASAYFATTVGLAAMVNGSTAVLLGIVKAVSDLPATSCTEDTCTWGPGSGALEANNYKLVVTKKTNPDRFEWALSGESKAKAGSGFTVFLSGTAIPSGTPHRGSGTVTLDFDARATLANPGNDTGKLTIDYSNTAKLTVSAVGTGLKDATDALKKVNVAYQYQDNADGSGDLDVAFRTVGTENRMSLHSRWKATGAGRGDVKANLGPFTYTASECWAAASTGFKVAFWVSTDPNAPTSGNEADCAFSPASYGSVSAP